MAVFNCTLSPAQVQALYSLALLGGPVTLSCQRSGADLVLGWPHGTLLQALDPNGPWTPVAGASPPSFTTTPAGTVFYRVQVYPSAPEKYAPQASRSADIPVRACVANAQWRTEMSALLVSVLNRTRRAKG